MNTCYINNYDNTIIDKGIEEQIKYQAEIYPKCHQVNESLYFEITGMIIMNGNNTSEDAFYNNSRAKKIKIIFNDEQEKIFELKDTMDIQLIDLQYKQEDISKPIDIKIEVLETYEGEKTKDIYISDIQFGVNSNITHGI